MTSDTSVRPQSPPRSLPSSSSALQYLAPHRPLGVRLANRYGGYAERLTGLLGRRLSLTDLDEASMLAAARSQAGCDDFGADDSWRQALRALVSSLEADAELTPLGRWCARGQIVGCLVNRLNMQRDWTTNPAILEAPVRRPVIVLGLPRSGTTLLQNLLGLDPANRSLLHWEAVQPSPPPMMATYKTDRRIAQASSTVRIIDYLAPSARALHPVTPTRPTECVTLFANSFASLELAAINWVPGYLDWCLGADMRPHYAYYRQQLQLLSSGHHTGRWALKSPAHLFWVDVLLETFPDAAVVQLHRDPTEVIASYCSLVATLTAVGSDRVDLAGIGNTWSPAWAEGLRRASESRLRLAHDPVHDVRYRCLLTDPVRVVREIYDRFDLPFTDDFARAISRFVADNPQHKSGVHRYSLEQFGLDTGHETKRYADYRERYGV